MQCGDCSRETREPTVKSFNSGNRQKMGNYFESLGGCPPGQAKRLIRADFCPDSKKRNRKKAAGEPRCAVRTAAGKRRAGARQALNVLGCRSARGRAPCSARLRAPGFRGHQHRAGEPGREGNLGELCPRSPESVLPLCSAFPRRLAQGSTFLASGSARLALGERS